MRSPAERYGPAERLCLWATPRSCGHRRRGRDSTGLNCCPLLHNGALPCPSTEALICDVTQRGWSRGRIFYVRNVEVGGSSPLTSTPKAQVMQLIASPYRPESYALRDSTRLNCVLWTAEGESCKGKAQASKGTECGGSVDTSPYGRWGSLAGEIWRSLQLLRQPLESTLTSTKFSQGKRLRKLLRSPHKRPERSGWRLQHHRRCISLRHCRFHQRAQQETAFVGVLSAD